jgi:hypothetical protein
LFTKRVLCTQKIIFSSSFEAGRKMKIILHTAQGSFISFLKDFFCIRARDLCKNWTRYVILFFSNPPERAHSIYV